VEFTQTLKRLHDYSTRWTCSDYLLRVVFSENSLDWAEVFNRSSQHKTPGVG